MPRGDEWELGKGTAIHLGIAAVLDFYEGEGLWPGIHYKDDGGATAQEVLKKLGNFACTTTKRVWQ